MAPPSASSLSLLALILISFEASEVDKIHGSLDIFFPFLRCGECSEAVIIAHLSGEETKEKQMERA